jgi:hypothetical protein
MEVTNYVYFYSFLVFSIELVFWLKWISFSQKLVYRLFYTISFIFIVRTKVDEHVCQTFDLEE